MSYSSEIIDTSRLFRPHTEEMLALLGRLSREQWLAPTCFPHWRVRDIASHLLQSGISRLSYARDGFPSADPLPDSDFDFVLNIIKTNNSRWEETFSSVSPEIILALISVTERALTEHLESLDSDGRASFAVNWAGETASVNWFDTAREWTERWVHHQQIREAVGESLLDDPLFFAPVIETFMRGAPFWYGGLEAGEGSRVLVRITGFSGGEWCLTKQSEGWQLSKECPRNPEAVVQMSDDTAWRLMSRTLSPGAAEPLLEFSGDMRLARHFLTVRGMMTSE